MSAPLPLIRTVAVVATITLVLASCSAGGSTETTTSAASPSPDTPTASADETTVQASEGGSKTLDEYLGVAANFVRGGGAVRGLAGFDDEQFAEEQRLIQQEIQICMQAEGFVYVPEEITGGLRVFLATANQGVAPSDYAATEGFGIATRFDAIFEGDLDLTDDVSPNDEHLATLSEGEADAWQLALSGAPPQRNAQGQLIDPDTGEVIPNGAGRVQGGCTRDAQVKVRGDFSVLADLEDEFVALDERIAADPRVAEIGREWADCMRTAGFAYETEDEARDEIQTQVGPLLRSFFLGDAAGQGDGQQAQGQGQGQGQGPRGPGNRLQQLAGLQLTPEQDAELNALQDLERAIAVASFECKGETDTEVEEITARYEAEFVEANREILESISS